MAAPVLTLTSIAALAGMPTGTADLTALTGGINGFTRADFEVTSIVNSRASDRTTSKDHGELRVVRMPGDARLLVVGAEGKEYIVTTAFQKDRLVESTETI